jgi:predicted alpha/beta-hydrolase family hydrolase
LPAKSPKAAPSAKKAAPSAKRAAAKPAKAALLLTPGASATRDHSALVAIDSAVSPLGVVVERINLPARAPAAVEAVKQAASALADRAGVKPERVLLGGRSFGGRMCSMAVAEGLPALGLALVSYPLHPPGKPENRRDAHFPAVEVPCLFVSGTRDAFGTIGELEGAVLHVRGPVSHIWLDGGDHGLRGRDATVAEAVRDWISGLLAVPASSSSEWHVP